MLTKQITPNSVLALNEQDLVLASSTVSSLIFFTMETGDTDPLNCRGLYIKNRLRFLRELKIADLIVPILSLPFSEIGGGNQSLADVRENWRWLHLCKLCNHLLFHFHQVKFRIFVAYERMTKKINCT